MNKEYPTPSLTIISEERFLKNSKGELFSPSGCDVEYWSRYFSKFGNLSIVGRVLETNNIPHSLRPIQSSRITINALPYYHGPYEYLSKRRKVKQALRVACNRADFIILRMPGQLGNVAEKILSNIGKPFGVELIGDPSDVFGNRGAGGIFRKYINWVYVRSTSHACWNASATSYVTEHTLQRRYPNNDSNNMHSYSSIILPECRIADEPRIFTNNQRRKKIITVGTLEQMTKGVDTTLKALTTVKSSIPNVELTIVGDGRCKSVLERMAIDLHCDDIVTFKGSIPNNEIFDLLDQQDIFVLASRGEGLPRSIIEAMARALPVISTNVSGTPELLPSECLVTVDDHAALANTLIEVLTDIEKLNTMSTKNLARANYYEANNMQKRRDDYFQHLITGNSSVI